MMWSSCVEDNTITSAYGCMQSHMTVVCSACDGHGSAVLKKVFGSMVFKYVFGSMCLGVFGGVRVLQLE